MQSEKPIIIEFPLRGEWMLPNTPGTKVPSHGTEQLGQKYAYDFTQIYWSKKGWQPALGNYLIMDCDNGIYAFFAHFLNGSINVKGGDNVKKGQLIGKVGHSGNSTAPHLHFHLMDKPDQLEAKGIPYAFESYEVFRENSWVPVTNGIPTNTERVRYNPSFNEKNN